MHSQSKPLNGSALLADKMARKLAKKAVASVDAAELDAVTQESEQPTQKADTPVDNGDTP